MGHFSRDTYRAFLNIISEVIQESLAYKELGFVAGDFLGTTKTTYYVRDAQGNVLSIYDQGAYFKYSTGVPANPTWVITPILGDVPVRRVAPPIVRSFPAVVCVKPAMELKPLH